MKIVGICASPRENKSTSFLLRKCLEEVRSNSSTLAKGIETEIIDLAGLDIGGCVACGKCKKGVQCSQDDDFQQIIPRLGDPLIKGLVLATPVYMGSMSSQAKAFLDRSVMFRRNGFLFKNIVGAVLTVGGSRNGGQELTIQAVHAAMMIHDMIIVGDGHHFGGTGWSNHADGYEGDEEGITTARLTGRRMAEVVSLMR
ncbi:MAG TPA: flavodoxin family protein [Desulfopila sp.]|nr:flavodoxin family protein [Desulfopila sp.]